MGNRTGRQKVLAIWNVYDTANAFYACVDLQVGYPRSRRFPRPRVRPDAGFFLRRNSGLYARPPAV